MNNRKSSPVIHPDLFADPALPSSLFPIKYSRNFSLGSTRNGGIVFPLSLTATVMVTREPHSEDVTAPACFSHFLAKILCAVCMGVIAVCPHY
jgi:hypothetical protein